MVGLQILILVSMGTEQQQGASSRGRIDLHSGNEEADNVEQPGPVSQGFGGGSGDDDSWTSLEALHLGMRQIVV